MSVKNSSKTRREGTTNVAKQTPIGKKKSRREESNT